MSVSIKGDFKKLQELAKRMQALKSKSTFKSLARSLGAEAMTLIRFEFRDGHDPYGDNWAPLYSAATKFRKIGTKSLKRKPLLDTGRLRNSFSAQPTENGFTVGSNVTYAKFHQYGTGGRKADATYRRFQTRRGRFTSLESAIRTANKSVAEAEAARRRVSSRRIRQRQIEAVRFTHVTFLAGTGKIPPRPFLPTADRGLGKWGPVFEETANKFFRRLFKKRG